MVLRLIKKHSILFSLVIVLLIILICDILNWTQDARIMNWVTFLIGLGILILLEGIKDSRFQSKLMRFLGFLILFGLVLYAELCARFELQTTFYKSCWSPNSKQIAFFMEKGLYNYRWGMIGGWSPDPIWTKYYLCTMDYDGNNFKQIKEIEKATNDISWSGSGDIVYILHEKSYEYRTKGIYSISPDATNQQEIYGKDNLERMFDPWLSRDKQYLGFLFMKVGNIYGIKVIDLKNNKEQYRLIDDSKTLTEYRKSYYGAFYNNEIAYYLNKKVGIYNLNSKKQITVEVNKADDKYVAMPNFDYGPISPDLRMTSDDVFRYYNKKYGAGRTKRSYLFNIFTK
jgi:hypothetical protein